MPCIYFAPLAYPQPIDVGLSVSKLGTSSVTYALAVFAGEDDATADQLSAASGTFVHVYVDADAPPVRDALEALLDTADKPNART